VLLNDQTKVWQFHPLHKFLQVVLSKTNLKSPQELMHINNLLTLEELRD